MTPHSLLPKAANVLEATPQGFGGVDVLEGFQGVGLLAFRGVFGDVVQQCSLLINELDITRAKPRRCNC